MEVRREGDRSAVQAGRFTGEVELELLVAAGQPTEPTVARVHFSEGAVTHWHSHPGGQLLYLVSGTGRVGTADGAHEAIPTGTVVHTPADEPHWHGADDGSDAVWLATTWGDTAWTDRSPLEG